MSGIPGFDRYVGIDYSGAETAISSLKGLRVYTADRDTPPVEVKPSRSPRKYWTRRGIAEWLAETPSDGRVTLVGIDHGFSFPVEYFEKHELALDWTEFLNDFQRHWPTDEDHVYVDFVREGIRGNGAARSGSARWRRVTEIRARAKSVFQFDVQGSVAKSTHAGIPWLLHLRRQTAGRLLSGHSTAGTCRPGDLLWPRSTQRCGTEASLARVGIRINRTRIQSRHGCAVRTPTAHLQVSFVPVWSKVSGRERKSKDGFWAFRDDP